jgi:GH18 family chitinase
MKIFFKLLCENTRYNKFNGMVLECTSLLVSEETYSNFALMMKKLYEALKKEKMSLVLVLLPYSENIINILTKNRFEYLSKYVDYFNVMTYDYVSYKSG